MSEGPTVIPADWPAPPGVLAYATTRHGGVSTGAYASLNLAAHVGDDPAAVAANRARLRAMLALPSEPCWLEQVHGTDVLEIDRGAGGPADAAITAQAGRVLAVLTADCLPVVLATTAGNRVGIAHAGWRGLSAGVLERTVAAMACPPAALVAWVGPAISAAAYEVGPEVRESFLTVDPGSAAAFVPNARNRWQADLAALARRRLAQLGIASVHGGRLCTYGSPESFYSHRRQAPCGRMATLVWRVERRGHDSMHG
jgi:YfiH family protein